jgi:predicted RNase H-like nuclease (RuvC/YqgF family)
LETSSEPHITDVVRRLEERLNEKFSKLESANEELQWENERLKRENEGQNRQMTELSSKVAHVVMGKGQPQKLKGFQGFFRGLAISSQHYH